MIIDSESKTNTASRSLNGLWTQWKGVIELYVRKEIARHQLHGDLYQQLHQKLLNACAEDPGGKTKQLSQMMADVARPWASLAALNEAPTKLLTDLWFKCQIVDQKIYGLHWSLKLFPTFSVAILGGLCLFSFFIALFVLTTTDLQKNQNLSEPLRWAVLHAKSFQSDVIGAMHGQFPIRMAGAIGVLLSLTLAYFTIRTRRSS